MSFTIVRIALMATALAIASSGCTYSRFDLPGQVGKYNDSMESIIETAVLENIIRASQDAPLGFTQVAVVRGSGSVTGQIGLPNLTFGPGQVIQQKQWVFSGNGISGSNNTNFDLAVLESKEFWLGLLTPLSPDTLAFFVRQGVPREILFYLYVQRAEIAAAGKSDILVNDPLDRLFPRFTSNLGDAVRLGLTVDTARRPYDFGPPLTAENTANIHDLIDLAKAGLSLKAVTLPASTPSPGSHLPGTPAKTIYQIQGVQSASVLCFDPTRAGHDISNEVDTQFTCGAATGSDVPPPPSGVDFEFTVKQTAQHPPASIKIYPRSTYDIVRYLGQLVRSGEDTGKYVDLVTDEAKADRSSDPLSTKLFVVVKNLPNDRAYMTVKYNGATYGIPKEATTTIRVLALVRQLIALSTSVNALPATNTVTTVP